ncbi:MAG: hypothetical protein IT303_16335 [Dehalococcoidia bacterium]|nr:hypothetical protein [Dehalococcoidia bacterium]
MNRTAIAAAVTALGLLAAACGGGGENAAGLPGSTPTATATSSATATGTATPPATPSATPTTTNTATPSPTPSATSTPTPEATPTVTATATTTPPPPTATPTAVQTQVSTPPPATATQPPAPTPTPTQAPPPPQNVVVTAVGNAWSNPGVSVPVGSTVTWSWRKSGPLDAPHNVQVAGHGGAGLAPSGSFAVTFTAAGSFAFECEAHPGMAGTVTVN